MDNKKAYLTIHNNLLRHKIESRTKTDKFECPNGIESVELIYSFQSLYRFAEEEKRLLWYLASFVSSGDATIDEGTGKTWIEIKIIDYLNFFKLRKSEDSYGRVFRAAISLFNTTVSYYHPVEERLNHSHFLTDLGETKDRNSLNIAFEPKVSGLLRELKKHYTTLSLDQIGKLTGAYTIRLYELLKSYASMGSWVVRQQDFRELMHIPEDTIKKFTYFERDTLRKSVTQINEKTDLYVKYKKGKSFKHWKFIDFEIHTKSAPRINNKAKPKSTGQSAAPQAPQQIKQANYIDGTNDNHPKTVGESIDSMQSDWATTYQNYQSI